VGVVVGCCSQREHDSEAERGAGIEPGAHPAEAGNGNRAMQMAATNAAVGPPQSYAMPGRATVDGGVGMPWTSCRSHSPIWDAGR